MPAAIRRTCFRHGDVRVGPECFEWYDPYTRAFSFEVVRPNVALVGGITAEPPPTAQEYRWVEEAMIREGLRMAAEKVIRDPATGLILEVRRRLLPMPGLRTPKPAMEPA